jgi:glycosyltransferase involved in cell wall biosynthesis
MAAGVPMSAPKPLPVGEPRPNEREIARLSEISAPLLNLRQRMQRKQKIVFVTIVPSPYQRDLFGALAAREEIDLTVYYLESAAPDSPWPEKELRSFEGILPGFWLAFGNVRAHVNWPIPDVADADFVVLSSFTSLTGQLLMRHGLRGRRWLFWGERMRPQSGVKRLIQTQLAAPIGGATGIISIGSAAEHDYRRRFPRLRHFCIPYHCELGPFFAIHRGPDVRRPITFLFCGQMIERKGVDLLLLTFDRLIANGIDARLLLVGREAELPRFMNLVSPATRARVQYEGFQAPERLPRYFAEADVFVLPSRHDGWGVVVNQALATGMPIISSDAVGAGLDYVENGINGVKVKAGDVDALYVAMHGLAQNPEIARIWGMKSRAVARALTPEAGADKWVRVFEALATS